MKSNSMLYRNKWLLLVFLLPAFIFMAVYLYYPLIQTIINSFQKIKGLGTLSIGWQENWYDNYVRLFDDPYVATAFKNTMLLVAAVIIFQVGMALVLALLVDSIKKGAHFFRTVYFFPIVISATALGLLFNMIFLYDGGMLNQLLQSLGIISENIDWKNADNFLVTMFTPVLWQYVGFYFVIIVTGLTNISTEIYEAASIDGASGWQVVRYIKIPLLRNTICSCLVLGITGALKTFDLPWIMFESGMPVNKSWLFGTYMYDQTFRLQDVDYGSTLAVAIVIIGVVLSRVSNMVFKEKDY